MHVGACHTRHNDFRFINYALCILMPVLPLTLGASARNALVVPSGRKVVIDGKILPGEWDGAGSIEVSIRPGWTVKVLFQHDATNLYFAFLGLRHGDEMRFPELLVDSRLTRSAKWQRGDLWLHSSFNLCEGDGKYNVYERNGVFRCSKEKEGWSANHFPLAENGVMEIQVSFAKLGLNPTNGKVLGFALDLTDTQENWTFWPTKAQLEHPSTWGTLRLD